jgi:hypothetical protein
VGWTGHNQNVVETHAPPKSGAKEPRATTDLLGQTSISPTLWEWRVTVDGERLGGLESLGVLEISIRTPSAHGPKADTIAKPNDKH